MATEINRNIPWRRERRGDHVVVLDSQNEIVCQLEPWSSEVDEQDGDLIAAAPIMLQALIFVPAQAEHDGLEQFGQAMLDWQKDYLLPALAKVGAR